MLNFVFNMTIFLFLFFLLFVYFFHSFALFCIAHVVDWSFCAFFSRYKNYERSSTQKIRYVILCECSGDLWEKSINSSVSVYYSWMLVVYLRIFHFSPWLRIVSNVNVNLSMDFIFKFLNLLLLRIKKKIEFNSDQKIEVDVCWWLHFSRQS